MQPDYLLAPRPEAQARALSIVALVDGGMTLSAVAERFSTSRGSISRTMALYAAWARDQQHNRPLTMTITLRAKEADAFRALAKRFRETPENLAERILRECASEPHLVANILETGQ